MPTVPTTGSVWTDGCRGSRLCRAAEAGGTARLAAEELLRCLLSLARIRRHGDRDCPFALSLGKMKEQGAERWRSLGLSSPAVAIDRDEPSGSELSGKPRPVPHPPEKRIRLDLASADDVRLVPLDGFLVDAGVRRLQASQKLAVGRLHIAQGMAGERCPIRLGRRVGLVAFRQRSGSCSCLASAGRSRSRKGLARAPARVASAPATRRPPWSRGTPGCCSCVSGAR